MNLVCAIVLRDNNVLIQRRIRKDSFVYEFPMGKIEQKESCEDGAIRELLEETGLNATLASKKSIILKNEAGDNINFVFLNIPEDENPKMTDIRRQQTFYWMDFCEIPIEDFHKPDREFIKIMSLSNLKKDKND